MRTSTKVFTALGVAGVVAVAGSAATGNGVTTNVGSNQFIGGAVSQNVIGATIDTVTTTRTAGTNNIATFVLTFTSADVDTHAVTLTTTGGSTDTYTCEAVGATTTKVSTCTKDNSGSSAITSYTVTVS